MTFNAICIIVCISCSVSTQCQHGWSVLISKLHHKDKRNTCQYKVILLPTARVKLFRRTRHSGSCCMNRQIIASWFHKAKSLIQIEVGSLLLGCRVFTDLLIWVYYHIIYTWWFVWNIFVYVDSILQVTSVSDFNYCATFGCIITSQQSTQLVTLSWSHTPGYFCRKLEHLDGDSPTSCEN